MEGVQGTFMSENRPVNQKLNEQTITSAVRISGYKPVHIQQKSVQQAPAMECQQCGQITTTKMQPNL